jgi:hypothetical protein
MCLWRAPEKYITGAVLYRAVLDHDISHTDNLNPQT